MGNSSKHSPCLPIDKGYLATIFLKLPLTLPTLTTSDNQLHKSLGTSVEASCDDDDSAQPRL